MDEREHPQSYYAATAHPFPALPALEGDTFADVAVIGGGYTGVSAALNLAERGYRVVLIEQARIGWGASGRNGGQINTGLRKGPIELIARYGRDRAKDLFELAEEARGMLRARVARHRIRCDLKANTLFVAHRPSEEEWMRAEVEALAAQGSDLEKALQQRAGLRRQMARVKVLYAPTSVVGCVFQGFAPRRR